MPSFYTALGWIFVEIRTHTADHVRWIRVPFHAGTHIRHDPPVGRVHKDIFNVWPFFAHLRFYGMNAAVPIEENAITVFALCQNGPIAGQNAVPFQQVGFRNTKIVRNSDDVCFCKVCPAEALAAVTALRAGKYLRITCHVGCPRRILASFDRCTSNRRPLEPPQQCEKPSLHVRPAAVPGMRPWIAPRRWCR